MMTTGTVKRRTSETCVLFGVATSAVKSARITQDTTRVESITAAVARGWRRGKFTMPSYPNEAETLLCKADVAVKELARMLGEIAEIVTEWSSKEHRSPTLFQHATKNALKRIGVILGPQPRPRPTDQPLPFSGLDAVVPPASGAR